MTEIENARVQLWVRVYAAAIAHGSEYPQDKADKAVTDFDDRRNPYGVFRPEHRR